MIGRSILHYKITEELGYGGMGKIYKAEDTRLERDVAIKFLPHHISIDPDQRIRFQREAKAAASLNHPNIAAIYNFEEVDDLIFMVMEFIDGQDLRKILDDASGMLSTPKLSIEVILRYAIMILQGLEAAHAKGIVHRDIKPENIMVTTEGQVKITDFGLAKMTGSELLTKAGTILGTVAYMSPEQLSNKPIDLRTDIWSWGVMLYEMISGERPFTGHYEQSIIYSIINDSPKPLQSWYPDIPPKLEEVINKTMAKNPDDRYSNCEQLLNDLQTCLSKTEKRNATQTLEGDTEPKIIAITPQKIPGIAGGYAKLISTVRKLHWKIAIVILFLAALCIYIILHKSPSEETPGKKIAVLPFININDDPADEYFSDGIMEDILTQLVKIGDLKVISRTTMMSYKNTNKTLREISQELDADIVLEGSVRRDAKQLRISAQLIDASTDEHLWAETYDKELKEVLTIQSEIAQKIAEALHTKLTPAEKDRLMAPATMNVEAYNLILKGSYYLGQGSREDVERAIEQFKQALSLEENNARAWAQLATAYARQADLGAVSTEEGYAKARQAAEKALELDDQLAQGHTIMGWIKRSFDWDWVGAEAECRKALELAPGDVTVIRNMANLEKSLGRFDQAIRLMQKASELDPKKVPIYTSLGLMSMHANRLQEAAAAYQKAIELNPQYPPAHTFLGLVYLLQGKSEEAIAEIQHESDEGWRLYGLAQAFYGAKRMVEADAALNSLVSIYGSESAYQVAAVYAYRGELDSAFEWLEKAYDLRDGGLSELKGDPFMKKIESDQRYLAFLKKMNLPL
jgi:serine/threonine protein kinase/tetratricopeptide (TPR) repeat protein